MNAMILICRLSLLLCLEQGVNARKDKLGETDKKWRFAAQSSALKARKKGIRRASSVGGILLVNRMTPIG